MKIKTLLSLISMVISLLLHAQDTAQKKVVTEGYFSLLTGVSVGTYIFGELGVARSSSAMVGQHPFFDACYASLEIKIGSKMIIAPKVGGWISGGMGLEALGGSIIYYSDFDHGSLVFRPEIGHGFKSFKVIYGYNAILSKYKLGGINRNLGSIVYCFKMKRLQDKIRYYPGAR